MIERKMRRSQYRPGTEHRMADFDERPAQIYVQAMAAARTHRAGSLASILSRFAGVRRKGQ